MSTYHNNHVLEKQKEQKKKIENRQKQINEKYFPSILFCASKLYAWMDKVIVVFQEHFDPSSSDETMRGHEINDEDASKIERDMIPRE